MADSVLVELMRGHPNPIERLAGPEAQLKTYSGWFAGISERTARFLRTGHRIAVLECGHYVLTRSLHRATCQRCGEMIRSGYDHDGFRKLAMPDEFKWAGDPLRELNECMRDDGQGTIARAALT